MVMALMDFVPVILFLIATVILQRGLYHRMSKGGFALFAGGTVMMICAGLMKAMWKLLYNLNVCDFERLNQAFLPLHSMGALIAGIAVGSQLVVQRKNNAVYVAVPAVFSGSMIFVAMLTLGSLGLYGGLGILGAREKKRDAALLFWIAFALMLGMGYLSTHDFARASVNWISEAVNIVGQGCFLLGARKLVRA